MNEDQLIKELIRIVSDRSVWYEVDEEWLEKALLFACFRYGATNDERLVGNVAALYRVASARLDVPARLRTLQELTLFVEGHRASCNALLPAIFTDPSTAVVSTAALNVAVLLPRQNGDPLTGPEYLIRMGRQSPEEATRVGIAAGLLATGDRRVVDRLSGCWRDLSDEGRCELAASWSGIAHAPVIELLVLWLEDCASSKSAEFGSVAGALGRIPLHANPRFVVEVERKFPVYDPEPGDELAEIGRWSFEAFGRRIGPRLAAVARTESAPRVLPAVLGAWGFGGRGSAAS